MKKSMNVVLAVLTFVVAFQPSIAFAKTKT